MADTGFVIAATGANLDDGGQAWTDPGNITADDGSNAVGDLLKTGSTDLLAATYANLSSLIPAGATIDGIEMQVQASQDTVGTVTATGSLSKNGTSAAGGTRNFSAFTTSPVNYTVGGAADLWDTTWTRAEVVGASFSTFFDATAADSRIVSVDAVWVKVYYTESGTDTPVSVNAGVNAAMALTVDVGKIAAAGVGAAVTFGNFAVSKTISVGVDVLVQVFKSVPVAISAATSATASVMKSAGKIVSAAVSASIAIAMGLVRSVIINAAIGTASRLRMVFDGRRKPFSRRGGISTYWRGNQR